MTIVHSKVQKCKRCVKVSNGANQVVRCIPSYLFRVERVLQGASIKYVCTDGGVQKLIVLAGYFILGPILRYLYKLSIMQRYRSSRSLDEFMYIVQENQLRTTRERTTSSPLRKAFRRTEEEHTYTGAAPGANRRKEPFTNDVGREGEVRRGVSKF